MSLKTSVTIAEQPCHVFIHRDEPIFRNVRVRNQSVIVRQSRSVEGVDHVGIVLQVFHNDERAQTCRAFVGHAVIEYVGDTNAGMLFQEPHHRDFSPNLPLRKEGETRCWEADDR